jgi:SAM-dependent methyltransferase
VEKDCLMSADTTCVICGRGTIRPVYDLTDRVIEACPSCGTGRTVYRGDSSTVQERYDRARWVETRSILSPLLEEEAAYRYLQLSPFNPGNRLLEVGCGTGEFLREARRHGHSVTGVDLSQAALDHIKALDPDMDIRRSYLHEAGFEPREFDAVVAFHVIEHVPDVGEFLGQVREILKPGGLVYIRVPNFESWYRRVLGRNWWGLSPEHVWHFSARGLDDVVRRSGFDVIERGSSGFEKYSLWPVLPLLYGNALHRLGNLVAPRGSGSTAKGSETPSSSGERRSVRLRIKRALIGVYLFYRRVGSLLLWPVFRVQNRVGGGRELYLVARKPVT